MLRMKSICVLLTFLAIHTSVKGQRGSEGRMWGDSIVVKLPSGVSYALHGCEIYEDSTMHGHFQRQCIICGKPVRRYWDIQTSLLMMC